MPTAKLIPAGIAYPPPKPVQTAKLIPIQSAARSVSTANYLPMAKAYHPPAPHHTSKLIQSGAKPGSLAKAVTRAPAPRPMKPMQHWLEAHQLA
jgi:hypothetical protein